MKIHFDITGDNSNIVSVVDDTTARMQSLGQTMQGLSQSFDFSNSAQSIKVLKDAIEGNEEVIKSYQKALEDLETKQANAALAGDTEAVKRYGDEMKIVAEKMQAVVDENNSLRSSLDSVNEALGKNEGIMMKLLGGQENYNKILSQLPPVLRSAVTGLNGMVGAAKAFIATPLGAILAALILAFKALSSWLHGSAEGQKVLAKISGALSGALAGLKQIVMTVGKALYNAFADPKKAAKDFVDFLKSQVVNRVQAVGEIFNGLGGIIKNVFTGNFDQAKDDLLSLGKAVTKFGTGIEPEKIAGVAKNVLDTAKAQADLSERAFKLREDRKNWLVESKELDKQIAEQRNKMRAGSSSERAAAAAKLQELVNKQTEQEVKFAKEEYEIKKETNALTDSSLEDLEEEERLRGRVIELETQGITKKGFALRIQDSMNQALANSAEKLKEIKKARQELAEGLSAEIEQNEREATTIALESQADGFEKQQALAELEHANRLAEIEKQHKERLKKIKQYQEQEYGLSHGGSLSGYVFDINAEEVKKENQNNELLRQNEVARYKQQQDAILEQYKTFTERYEQIEADFAAQRRFLIEKGSSTESLKLLADEEKKALEEIGRAWADSKVDEELSRWATDLAGKSFVDLQVILDGLEGQLDYLGDSLPVDEVTKIKAQILLVKKAIEDGNFADETGEMVENAKDATVSWADLNKVLTDTAALFKQAGDAIGGPFGEAIKLVGNFTTQVAQMGNAVNAFKKAANSAEKFSAGLSIAGAALSIATSIAGQIKESREQTEKVNLATQAYYRTLKTIQDSKVLESFSNAFGTDTLGQFRVNIDIASQAKSEMDKMLTDWKARWTEVYGEEGRFVANSLVSNQQSWLQRTLGSSKNITHALLSDFFDEDGNLLGEKLRAWYDTYGEGLGEEQKKLIENLLGEYDRLMDATDNIASFLGDMFGDVAQDMATDMVDSFIETGSAISDMSKYMADFGKNIAKSIVQAKLMEKVFTEDDQDAIAKLIASGKTEEAIKYYNGLMDKARDLVPEINSFLSGIDLQALAEQADDTRTASSRSSLGASQDSIDESNGRLTAIQDYVFQMIGTVSAFKESNDRLITTAALVLEHTQGIHLDTSELRLIQSDMREVSRQINRNVSQIVEKGVVMR